MADKPERTSRYQPLEKPEFKSTIPPHLVDKLTPEMKWIVESLSRMEAVYEWLLKAALDANRIDLESDLRTQELEDWKALISSKWSVVGGFLLLCLPILVEKVVEHMIK